MRWSGAIFGVLCWTFLSVVSGYAADEKIVGVEVGLNISNPLLDGSVAAGITSGTKAGLLIGGSLTAPLVNRFAIQPELIYTQKHGSLSSSGFSANENWDFLEFPVLIKLDLAHAKVNWRNLGQLDFYLVAGPGIGFLVHASETDRIEAGVSKPGHDVKDQLKKLEVSIVEGAGVSVGKVQVEARYDMGLRNINDSLNSDPANLSVKARAFSIVVRRSF